jgi:hypothetical protein
LIRRKNDGVRSEWAHNLALNATLRNFRDKLAGANPTVLWSGNGYHIYQPIDAFILEEYDIFSQFVSPPKRFLKFVEQYLSNHKSDPSHNPSFKSCLIRIPGSYNSKCYDSTQIKIIQNWDGHRPKINQLLLEFHTYLVQQKLIEIKQQKSLTKYQTNSFVNGDTLPWIEKLLATPISDYRKNAISLVLPPYLINIKKGNTPELGTENNG